MYTILTTEALSRESVYDFLKLLNDEETAYKIMESYDRRLNGYVGKYDRVSIIGNTATCYLDETDKNVSKREMWELMRKSMKEAMEEFK